jgi:peptidoglycan/LPS O-acetylase OafA/YrhL
MDGDVKVREGELLPELPTAAHGAPEHKTKYRGDIDGLRAVAVVPVVLFHAGVSGISGGFVGVDVFFVISGFLISQIIASEIGEQRFSLARFYERRVRRILPAFLFVTAITFLASLILLLPQDLARFGDSLQAASLSGSNILFWLESGDYFANKSDLKPLLHTWSLGVEEQFYVVFPLLLMAVSRLRGWRFLKLIAVISLVLSLALSVYATDHYSIAAFYLLPTRAWELLAGTILAIGVVPPLKRRLHAEIVAALGLAAIVAGILLFNGATPFPGWAAIAPVAGAAMIIHAGSTSTQTLVGRLLSTAPMRWIGLISFSLYLWHWPLIVFTKYYFIEPSLGLMSVVVALSFVLAYLTWRFVEQPLRRAKPGGSPRGPLVIGVAALAVSACAGVVLAKTDGFPGRISPQIVRLSEKATHQGPRRDCGFAYDKKRTVDTLCVLGAPGVAPTFLIVGDSHADAMAAAAFEAGARVGQSGYQISATGYRPVLGYRKRGEPEKYAYLNPLVVKLLDTHPEVREIIVVGYWKAATVTDDYIDAQGRRVSGPVAMSRGLNALIDRYPDRRFLVTTSTADSPSFGGQPAARAAMFHRPFDPRVPRAEFDASRAAYAGILTQLAAKPNVRLMDLAARTCDAAYCHGQLGGRLLYTDDNHLSFVASRLYLGELSAFLKNAPAGDAAPRTAPSGARR